MSKLATRSASNMTVRQSISPSVGANGGIVVFDSPDSFERTIRHFFGDRVPASFGLEKFNQMINLGKKIFEVKAIIGTTIGNVDAYLDSIADAVFKANNATFGLEMDRLVSRLKDLREAGSQFDSAFAIMANQMAQQNTVSALNTTLNKSMDVQIAAYHKILERLIDSAEIAREDVSLLAANTSTVSANGKNTDNQNAQLSKSNHILLSLKDNLVAISRSPRNEIKKDLKEYCNLQKQFYSAFIAGSAIERDVSVPSLTEGIRTVSGSNNLLKTRGE